MTHFFIDTQAINFRPSTDRQNIYTQNLRGRREDDLRFEILIFDLPKKLAGKTPKFRQILRNGRQSEIHNFEMARHIDKQI